ncbi:MAG: hypothetical protein CM15mP10_2940 [Actinomycetota bacterium]|nr:MAG: hypothetical protein CM15mP10_2940 [Actinomycetota bacterium]
MTNSAFRKQIGNRNFLSGVGFKFNLTKFPKVDFFSNSARIPELSLELTTQASYLKNIDVPGERLTFGDFNLRFLVDENMENYLSVYNWLTGLGFPETTKEFAELIKDKDGQRDPKEAFCDGTLRILNSNYREVAQVKFKDLFPISLSSLEFDATNTDVQFFTADATFKYTIYDLKSSL